MGAFDSLEKPFGLHAHASLVDLPVTSQIIEMLSYKAANVIAVKQPENVPVTPVPRLHDFIRRLISHTRSSVNAPVLALASLYLDRLRVRLPPTARGLPCTRHRVFIAALIVSFKYLNDVGIRNRHWAQFTAIFSLSEVNLMELQFLQLIDHDLSYQPDDLLMRLRSVGSLPSFPAPISLKPRTLPQLPLPVSLHSMSDLSDTEETMSMGSTCLSDHGALETPPALQAVSQGSQTGSTQFPCLNATSHKRKWRLDG